MAYTQQHRIISIETPLGKDVLLLQGFTGEEGISRLFRFNLDLLSEKTSIDFEAIVGKNVTITVRLPDDQERYMNGIISRFSQGGSDVRFASYRAEMVPWTWLMTRTADCRIFQNMSVPDIIKKIFEDLGFKDFKNRLQKTYSPREYCVQYRETDFNFVSRLMEQYGIFYYFEHEKGKHTLVMADSSSAHKPCPNKPTARYERTAGGKEEEDVVTAWLMEQEVRPGKYALTDYNFKTPNNSLLVNVESIHNPPAGTKYEIYDYPGEYLKRSEGDDLVKLRIEEEEAVRTTIQGSGTCRAFSSGFRFDLTGHYRADLNKPYLLASVSHHAVETGYMTGDLEGGFNYSNTFTCIPLSVPFRPARVTPRPVIQGTQSAVVVGKKGEEIWVDEFGRVKVQFHWDREGKKDEKSSCWIRVAQNWAGKNWGAMFIPRIGQEVLVDFLEGDPDQPIIIGRVYNADQLIPYRLPAEQTKSTVKSNSSKGGGGFNELRFEDKKGKEQIYIQGQKELDIVIKNNRREWIGKDRHLMVVSNKLEDVGADSHVKIAANQNTEVGADVSNTIGGNLVEQIGMSHCEQVGQEIYLKSGMKVVVEAGLEITLKSAGGFVKIDPMGVTIQGNLVLINSGGSAGSGSAKSPTTPKKPSKASG